MDEDPDMDIEETTFIYPRIESIYSDVNIKAEPMDDDEDEYEPMQLEQPASDYYMPIPNKIILGSKPPSNVQLEPKPGPSTASDNWEDQENFFECSECNLLYPTQNELDSHKMSAHSFLVARPLNRAIKPERRVSASSNNSMSYLEEASSERMSIRRQKALKSTAKSALNKTFPTPHNLKSTNSYRDMSPVALNPKKDDKGDMLLCKHCDVRFPDEIALIKHTYELLPEANLKCDICHMSFDSQPSLNGHKAKHFKKTGELSKKDSDMLIQCIYCTCYLMYEGFMKTHLLKNHKVTDYEVKHVKYSGKCAICSKVLKDYKLHNKHILKHHRKVFMSKTRFQFDTNPVKLKCMLCAQIFTSRYSAYKHKTEKHPGQSQKQTFYTVYDKPIKQLPANPPAIPEVSKPKPLTSKHVLVNKTYIPKQDIFKCNKCQIHFVSCSAAFAHSKRCSLAKGDWKCDKCRRTFTKAEKQQHMQQHQFSEKLKVHIVSDKILSQVLCRCPKCELLFDEISFAEHVSGDCVPKNGLDCKYCDLKIHLDSFAKHMRYHSKYNFTSADFIIIDFVDTSFQNAPIQEEKKGQFRQKLVYCSTCNCHFYMFRVKHNYHMEGKCKWLKKRLCTTCGLTFASKTFNRHVSVNHESLNLKLNEIKFVRVQDYKTMNPVMPIFHQCEKCDVLFITPVHKNNHNCSKIVFEKCSICQKKYDPVSYDLHLSFHNYTRSKSEVSKTSAVQLKFYSCIACHYGFNNYDSVVEHCQKHYTNSEDLKTKYCKICKLSFAEPHKVAHASADIEILKFDHDKLLTEDWLTGFGSLSKDEVDDILSKSIYSDMRNVRLCSLIEGPTERTLYRCAQCQLNFEKDYVLDHTIESCGNSPRFACGSCTAAFNTRVAKNNHMNVHVVYGDDITFREIVFNNEDDKELNEALRTGRQKESLKFRKCLQCKLLIKKSDFDAHISAHSKVEVRLHKSSHEDAEIIQYTSRVSDQRRTYKLFKPRNGTKKLFTVYKCKTCKASIWKRVNIVRHICTPRDKYEKCSRCCLSFLPCNIKRHIEQHKLNPKFTQKNMSVYEFLLVNNITKKSSESSVKKRRRYSSDDDASTGGEVTVEISKTYDTRKVVGKPYSDNLSEDSQDSILDGSSEKTMTSNAYAKQYIKKSVEKVESDCETDVSHIKVEYSPEKSIDLSDTTLDVERWRIEMRNKLYQCEKCYVCFSHKHLLLSHLPQCDGTSLSETPLVCDQCELVFHPSITTFHEKLHELVRQNPIENYFYLVNISTNGVHTNIEKRWLRKCKACNLHYLNIKSLKRHYSLDHVVSNSVECEICGLKFTKSSCTRHMRIHHKESNLTKEDFHIEILDTKIVGLGEVHLTPFVESYSRIKQYTVEIEFLGKDTVGATDISVKKEDAMDIDQSVAVSTENFENDSNISDPKDIESNPDVSYDKYEKIDHNLYECKQCSQLYLTNLSLIRHTLEANHKSKPIHCDLCGLPFSKRTLQTHKSKQHYELNLTREDFVINNLKPTDDSEVLKESSMKKNKSDDLVDVNLPLNEEKKTDLSEELKEVAKKMKTSICGPIDNHIYKCVECSVFYTNRRTLLLHIIIRKHQQFDFTKCDICGLMFGKGSLIKHKNVQHEKLKLTRKDFIITDVFGSQLPDDEDNVESGIKYATSMTTDDLPQTEQEEKELDSTGALEVKKDTEIKIFKLHQCKDCKICIQKSERKLHVCCSDIQKKQCINCCLYFRSKDMVRHKRLHRKYRELSRRNFELARFGRRSCKQHKIYKCVSCSTHFLSLNALEWHMKLNHQTKRDSCNICGLFFWKYSLSRHIYVDHDKLNLTAEQFNIIYVSDKNPPNIEDKEKKANLNNSNDTTGSEPETLPDVKTVKKLFKCVECDVYFLTRASYYKHIYKHKKLDPTEYIDCNICDFQFLNESLGVHMKTHKDKSFCLDKLLIEEYQPNSADLPKIELYFAKDSLNSKLVSTTTPFDNYDENLLSHTDEQLSVIDSTSDEVPKARTNKEVGVGNSFAHNTASSLEESNLNPIVEPNLDVSVKLSD